MNNSTGVDVVQCINSPNHFCNICGRFTSKNQKRPISNNLMEAYYLYFGFKIEEEKAWAPQIVCKSCEANLIGWLSGKKRDMPYTSPMIWKEQTDHVSDCYFCMTKISGYSKKTKDKIIYPDCKSAIKNVMCRNGMVIPTAPINMTTEDEINEYEISEKLDSDSDYSPETKTERQPKLFGQGDLKDLVRDLKLPKDDAELL